MSILMLFPPSGKGNETTRVVFEWYVMVFEFHDSPPSNMNIVEPVWSLSLVVVWCLFVGCGDM